MELPCPAASDQHRGGRCLLEVTLNGEKLDEIDISSPASRSRSRRSTASSGYQRLLQSPRDPGKPRSSRSPQHTVSATQRPSCRQRKPYRPDLADALGTFFGVDIPGLASNAGASPRTGSRSPWSEPKPERESGPSASTRPGGTYFRLEEPTTSSTGPHPYVTSRVRFSPGRPSSPLARAAQASDLLFEPVAEQDASKTSGRGPPEPTAANFETPPKSRQSPFNFGSSPATSSPRLPYHLSPKNFFSRFFPCGSHDRRDASTSTTPISTRSRMPSTRAPKQPRYEEREDLPTRRSQATMSHPGPAFHTPPGQGQAFYFVHPSGVPNVYTAGPQPVVNAYMAVPQPLHQQVPPTVVPAPIPQPVQPQVFRPGMPMPQPTGHPAVPVPGAQIPQFAPQAVAPGANVAASHSAPVTPVDSTFPSGPGVPYRGGRPASSQYDARRSSGYKHASERLQPRSRLSTPSFVSFETSDSTSDRRSPSGDVPAGHFCMSCGQIRSRGYHEHHPIRPGKKSLPNLCGKCRGRIYSASYKENQDNGAGSKKNRDEVRATCLSLCLFSYLLTWPSRRTTARLCRWLPRRRCPASTATRSAPPIKS